MYPRKSSQNSKHHTIADIICSQQNHTSAGTQGKSQSAATDSAKRPHIPTPGIQMKEHSCNIPVLKGTQILEFLKMSLQPILLLNFLKTFEAHIRHQKQNHQDTKRIKSLSDNTTTLPPDDQTHTWFHLANPLKPANQEYFFPFLLWRRGNDRDNPTLQKCSTSAEEKPQCFTIPAALTEDLCSLSSTHTLAHTPFNINSRESSALL